MSHYVCDPERKALLDDLIDRRDELVRYCKWLEGSDAEEDKQRIKEVQSQSLVVLNARIKAQKEIMLDEEFAWDLEQARLRRIAKLEAQPPTDPE